MEFLISDRPSGVANFIAGRSQLTLSRRFLFEAALSPVNPSPLPFREPQPSRTTDQPRNVSSSLSLEHTD
jgi:hypothetical protein